MKKQRKRVRKQSGDRASKIAARILAKTQSAAHETHWFVATKDLKTLCASVLSQDETKGPRK